MLQLTDTSYRSKILRTSSRFFNVSAFSFLFLIHHYWMQSFENCVHCFSDCNFSLSLFFSVLFLHLYSSFFFCKLTSANLITFFRFIVFHKVFPYFSLICDTLFPPSLPSSFTFITEICWRGVKYRLTMERWSPVSTSAHIFPYNYRSISINNRDRVVWIIYISRLFIYTSLETWK